MNKETEKLIFELKAFAEWVETLGSTDCEIYKHELKANADLALERIDTWNTRAPMLEKIPTWEDYNE